LRNYWSVELLKKDPSFYIISCASVNQSKHRFIFVIPLILEISMSFTIEE